MSVATIPSPSAISARIASRLAERVGPHKYAMWFDRSARIDLEHEARQLRVAVPNAFVADWIGRHFGSALREAAAAELGDTVDLALEVEPDRFESDRAPSSRTPEHEPSPRGQAGDDISAAPTHARGIAQTHPRLRHHARTNGRHRPTQPLRYRLEDFVQGPANALALSAAQRIADDDQPTLTQVLFLHGGCGLGKTHLLQGICRAVQERDGGEALYVTAEQFTNEYIQAARKGELEKLRRRLRTLDLLAIDDVHFMADKTKTQQEFLHTFDALELHGSRVVLAADRPPRRIEAFSPALISRCLRGMVVELAPPDTTTRLNIVKALARRRGISLLETVVAVLAGRCNGSVREIEGLITKLHALAGLATTQADGHMNAAGMGVDGTPTVGHTLVQRLFDAEDLGSSAAPPVHIDTVIDVVAEATGVDPARMAGRSRRREDVLARSLVIYLTRDLTKMSYPEIARALGRTSHSSVVTAHKRMEKQLSNAVTNPQSARPVLDQRTLPEVVDTLARRIRQRTAQRDRAEKR